MSALLKNAALGAALLVVCAGAAQAAEALRPEIGKPLAKAAALMNAHNYRAAMQQVNAASAVRGLTGNERFVIEEMRGSVAQRSGDNATASKVFADMLASGQVPAGERVKLLAAESSMSFSLANYPGTIAWLQKYFAAGGADPAMRSLLISAYYKNKDYANAGRLQAQQIAATVKAGQRPTEQQLQLLAACQEASGDKMGFGNTMLQLVTYYPKPDYWQNLIHSAQTKQGFSDRFTLDIDRFELETGLLTKPDDFMEMTELALQVPLPGEAKAIIDKGYAAGALGNGPGATRQQRLRDLVNKTFESEKTAMNAREAEAQGAHDGNLLASLGEEHVSYGEFPKGIALMQAGMRKDELRHAEDTKLHLGLAYMRAGNKPQALRVLRSVGGKEGAAEVARLWILRLTATA